MSKGPADSQPSPTPRNSPKPTNQHLVTQSMDLQYDIIDDLKKQRANISMFDLLKIYPMPGGSILSNLTTSSNTKTKNHPSVPSVNNLDPSTSKTTVGLIVISKQPLIKIH